MEQGRKKKNRQRNTKDTDTELNDVFHSDQKLPSLPEHCSIGIERCLSMEQEDIAKKNEYENQEMKKYVDEVRYLIPPQNPIIIPLFDRFKDAYINDAKKRGDNNVVKNISQITKEKWKLVKNFNVDLPLKFSSFSGNNKHKSQNISHLLHLKYLAKKVESVETETYQYNLRQFCERYNKAATIYLKWCILNITDENEIYLEEVIKIIECKVMDWDNSVQRDYLIPLENVKEFLMSKKSSNMIQNLVHKLSNATEEELTHHAREYFRALNQVQELALVKSHIDYLLATEL